MTTNKNNDTLLWDQLRAGNREAFETIYQSEIKYLYNYGRKVFNDELRTEDAIHDLFVELWERRDRLGATDCIRKYLAVSMRRKMVGVLKKEKRMEGDLEQESVPFDAELSIEALIIESESTSEKSEKLRKAYSNLSNRQREVLYMRYYQDMDYEQIAETVGIQYQSLRNLVSGAVRGLRVAMATLLVILIATSCADEDTDGEVFIEEEIMPYILSFQSEGEHRGRTIDIVSSGIGAELSATTDNAVGQCVNSNSKGMYIRLDPEYWNQATQLEKEFLIFHELGHCYLGREHDDSFSERGMCSSMMMSGVGPCRKNYSSSTRESYLDELFSK